MQSLRIVVWVFLVAFLGGSAHADVTGKWAASGPLGNPTILDLAQGGGSLAMTIPIRLTGSISSDGVFGVATFEGGFGIGIGGRFVAGETYFVANVVSGAPPTIVFGTLGGMRCECFDGNAEAGDGCDPRCQIEPCFTCTAGVPSVCTPLPDGAACTDRNVCTSGETCTGGVCGGGTPIVPCVNLTGSWFVRESSLGTPRQTTFRTVIRQRGGALELGGTSAVVPTWVGAIDPVTGVFDSWLPIPSFGCGLETRHGNAAPDGNTWTGTGEALTPEADFCVGDAVAVSAWRCGSGTLDPGEQCDDGNAVTGDGCSDTCQSEFCATRSDGTPCDDGRPCTTGDVCQGGACAGAQAPAGTPCDDGVACTSGEACDTGGECAQGTSDCPPCQTCSAASGCIPGANGTSCDDGNPCTDSDACRTGACQGQAEPAGTPCDDGSACTSGDACDGTGQCHGSSTCAPCQTCSASSGCIPADGAPCDDGNPCTGSDACRAGVCEGPPAPGTPCDDGNACTGPDGCSTAGVCQGTSNCGICQRCAGSGCVAAVAESCSAGDPGAVSLLLADRGDPTRIAVDFRWKRAAGGPTDFGRPDLEDDYALCVFDTSSPEPVLLFRVRAPGAAGCPVEPCWDKRARGGFRYRNPQRKPDGLLSLALTRRGSGEVRVLARGKGPLLAGRPFGLPVTPTAVPLTVQVVGESGACTEGRFAAANVRVNKLGKLKAKLP